jgi:hypothetical protein
MWPATIELLAIAAVIASIVAYSGRSVAKSRQTGSNLAAQGRPNSESTANLAATGEGQPRRSLISTAEDQAAGNRWPNGQGNLSTHQS